MWTPRPPSRGGVGMTEPRGPSARRRSVRGRGTGSITAYGTKAGTRWRFQVNLPVDVARPEIGKRKHPRGGFTSCNQAADAELTLLRADLMRQVPQPRRPRHLRRLRPTLARRARRRKRDPDVQPACPRRDGPLHRILPDGRHPCHRSRGRLPGPRARTRQTPSQKRGRKGLATPTVARYANWVNTIFLAALDEGIVARNPANSKHSGRPRG